MTDLHIIAAIAVLAVWLVWDALRVIGGFWR